MKKTDEYLGTYLQAYFEPFLQYQKKKSKKMQNQVQVMRKKIFEKPKIAAERESKKIEKKVKEVLCQICLCQVKLYQKARICYCIHTYCEECLINYILQRINDFQLIICPNEHCFSSFDENCGLFLSITPEERKKYKKIKFQKNIQKRNDIVSCPNSECEEGIINLVRPDQKTGKCVKCGKIYCLECRQLRHLGKKCEDKQEKLLNMLYNYRKCKGCQRIVEKISGCPHITCKCGFQFCYKCGKKWSSMHTCIPEPVRTKIQEKRIFYKIHQQLDDFWCLSRDPNELTRCISLYHFFRIFLHYIFFISFLIMWVTLCIIVIPSFLLFFILMKNFQFIRRNCFPASSNKCKIFFYIIFFPLVAIFIAFFQCEKQTPLWNFCTTGSFKQPLL